MRLLYLFLFALAACGHETWYVTPSGLHYRVLFTNGRDSLARMGGVAKLRYIQLFHDTVRRGTGGQMPLYQQMIPGLLEPYSPMEALVYGLRQGDSVEAVQRLDSMVSKKLLSGLPPGTRGSDTWTTRFVVERIFEPDFTRPGRMDSLLAADKAEERRRLDSLYTRSGPVRVRDWLDRHHIAAQQEADEPFVQVLNAGSGARLDSGSTAQVILKLSTLGGQRIALQKDTIWLCVGRRDLPSKIDQALRGRNVGCRLLIYTPTMDAFGGYPPGTGIPPYADLVFDLEILGKK
jgi:hypothetical protein